MNTYSLLLLVSQLSNVKWYWWSLLSLTNWTNPSSIQNGKTQPTCLPSQGIQVKDANKVMTNGYNLTVASQALPTKATEIKFHSTANIHTIFWLFSQ